MRFHTVWRAALPALIVSAACSESDAPTALASQPGSFEIVGAITTVAACDKQIADLTARTQSLTLTPISGKNAETKERPGLVKILNDARNLLAAGKSSDAVTKLNDYVVKVEQLAAAGRITPDVATGLTAAAQDAITCINTIGA